MTTKPHCVALPSENGIGSESGIGPKRETYQSISVG